MAERKVGRVKAGRIMMRRPGEAGEVSLPILKVLGGSGTILRGVKDFGFPLEIMSQS